MLKRFGRINTYVLLPLMLLFSQQVAVAPAQTPHKAYILCETKTGEASRWFFSSIFMEGPEVRSSSLENAFTRYVMQNYRSDKDAIGPADCFISRTRDEADYHHSQQQKWATSQGNSVIETGWTYSE